MRSIPIRGSRSIYNTDLPSSESLITSHRGMSLAADENNHDDYLPSAFTAHEHNNANTSNAGSSAQGLPSPSSEFTETQSEDHMDWSPPSPLLSTPNLSETSSSGSDSDTLTPTQDHLKLTDLLPLPTSSPGYLTHAHQQAMANRTTYDKLLPGGAFDPALYTPVFLHDTLMLPGSLATVLGKDSPLDILDRLTPARLPSFTLFPHHAPPHIPCLLPSHPSPSAVTGLILLGTGRDARKAIKAHYRPVAKRARHKVVVEVRVPISPRKRASVHDMWRLEARWVEAQVFVWRGAKGESSGMWSLGEAIEGVYGSGCAEIEVVENWGRINGEVDGESSGEGQWEVGDLRLDGRSEWAGSISWHGREVETGNVEW